MNPYEKLTRRFLGGVQIRTDPERASAGRTSHVLAD